ncbi:MAG: S-layer homology domain-containing protein [Gammaproteobacteria bacterium]|nr:S-layer homology domain-containing protein [Gammaproteobacteria bacterium]
MNKTIISIFGSALISAGAMADTSEKAFGPSTSYTTITEHGFVEDFDIAYAWGIEVDIDCGDGNSDRLAFAPLNLDSGVLITRLDIYGEDNDATLNVDIQLLESCESTLGPNTMDTLVTVKSNGSPGMFAIGGDLSSTIDAKNCAYAIRLDATADNAGVCPSGDDDLETTIDAVRIGWQRQIAPGPSTPSFFDVLNSHPFYDSIEALASSGITGGCGGSNYCPDDAVTRGQFAAFFTRALGLGFD